MRHCLRLSQTASRGLLCISTLEMDLQNYVESVEEGASRICIEERRCSAVEGYLSQSPPPIIDSSFDVFLCVDHPLTCLVISRLPRSSVFQAVAPPIRFGTRSIRQSPSLPPSETQPRRRPPRQARSRASQHDAPLPVVLVGLDWVRQEPFLRGRVCLACRQDGDRRGSWAG